MIDFIEYLVSELKSKRLSKTNAVALVRQFSRRSIGPAAVIHPLLHRNTSDLSEQRYCSTFTGEEFFLTDHQVKTGGGDSRKVLPGVAYLEMARAAVEQALPERPEAAVLELLNTVWAQPVVVPSQKNARKDLSIALLSSDDEHVDYEIYSQDAGRELVHCQGRAVWKRERPAATIDLEQLRSEMSQGELTPESVYATCARMGLVYGPAFRSITAIHRGNGQLLAELRRPSIVAHNSAELVLHPSLMDGALQAAVGLLEGPDSDQPRLPFALDTLRILSPCTGGMVAWLRHAAGSRPSDKVARLDIDLCDADGNVCVQMHGFSWRVLSSELGVTATQRRAIGSLLATPVWHASDVQTRDVEFAEHHVLSFQREHKTIAQNYSEHALGCFERIQAILRRRPQGKVLIQIVVTDDDEQGVLAGLSGLLRTAALENPQVVGQVILVPAEMSAEELARHLEAEKRGGLDPLVRVQNGVRHVSRWQEIAADAETSPIAFKDQGLYLITGGLGGLGVVFAREILEKTRDVRVVLTGRSTLSVEKQAALDALSARSGRVIYRQLDLANADEVRHVIAAIQDEYGPLNGILHSAGMIADDFILKKESSGFSAVLEPKVAGTFNLDHATRDLELDFFALFSAIAGAMGNLGQADYAAANAFMDHFAVHRNRQVAAGRRYGRTRSIDWPLWQAGGMVPDAASRERLQKTTGMQPMQSAVGLDAFHRILALPYDQVLVVEGDLAQIRRTLLEAHVVHAEQPPAAAEIDSASLAEKAQQYLRKQFSEILKVPAQKIDPRAPLENYGIDSILAMKLTNQLETTFGSLPKTLFFEYQTVRDLAEYFVVNHPAQWTALFAPAASQALMPAPAAVVSNRRSRRRRSTDRRPAVDDEPIAIIGLSGRYPEAVNLEAYWENLRDGKDCITEVPKDRWDWREYFSEDRTKNGHHYSKWGGFIEGVDEFDPLFFNISPADAEAIDPQERLFLQHAWMAIEDAGYTRARLQMPYGGDLPGQAGVYAGVMYTEYQMFGAEALARGKRLGVPGSAASIANRVSYALNLHGPSMTLDTMCSSSLTAIHIACQDLKQGRTSLAIAGGVNVSIHPNKYLVLSEGQFISSDGHCQSFGEGGDGYIPGEGVGVVVLKRLADATRDGDHIYAIIRGSSLTHGGKTNGYSVPNPQAQTSAISRALAESKTDARHISYIEAHGTGTKLGDPIEIAALSKAFQKYTQDTGYCLIGSAKSNIGHCESAAGIAGLTKVLLQMQHKQIVPSLHSAQLNPHIDFPKTPFIVNQALIPWEPPVVDGRTLPRIAGISSFGAGGSNAHMIVEEAPQPVRQPVAVAEVVILLSARSADQVRQKARDLLAFLRAWSGSIDLASMAYTLQLGREAMDERLGLMVSSVEQLAEKLEAYLAGARNVEDVHYGKVARNAETVSLLSTDTDLREAFDKWIANGKISKLLELWVTGLEVDWSKLWGEVKPRLISLPTYPFARERYWVDAAAGGSASAGTAVLHPLLHCNTSDLSEQRYSSTFTGEEFFLADHQVTANGGAAQKMLPGVAYLEMARAAIAQAVRERPESAVLELLNTVWAQPIVVSAPREINITLIADDNEQVDFEIYSQDSDQEIVHCQGRAVSSPRPAPVPLDLEQLEGLMERGTWDPARVYAECARLGLVYGPSFQGITAIHQGNHQLLAHLRLPAAVEASAKDYVLHPSLMDGALQACVALIDGSSEPAGQPRVPFALESLRIISPCTAEMVAWVRDSPGSQAGDSVVKVDIDLCDARGNVCVQMHGFSSRAQSSVSDRAVGALFAAPVWQAVCVEAPSETGPPRHDEHHVILCGPLKADAQELASLVPQSHCLSLPADSSRTLAQRYTENAVVCFERIQSFVQSRQGPVLVQMVVADEGEAAVLAGLSGLLKTAALENPHFVGQLLLVPPSTTTEELVQRLRAEMQHSRHSVIRYVDGTRHVLGWQEVAVEAERPPIAFKDAGVYLITGGLGGLGVLFAQDILQQTRQAQVILTGRSPLTDERQARLNGLSAQNGRVSYRQLDLSDLDQVERLIEAILYDYTRLDGILHCAGMIADRLILKKTSAEFREVLAPKVTGSFNLDQASQAIGLDFFALFSSLAGVMGNPGQADYAAANGFMDQFAAWRNRQVAAKQRQGRTLSINWPLWQAGGMEIDPATRELLRQTTGVQAMQTATGMDAFRRSLALPYDQVLVVEGDVAQLRRGLFDGPAQPRAEQPVKTIDIDRESFADETQDYLRRQLSGVLKLASQEIDPDAPFEQYGIDSILAMKLTNQLEKTFGSLAKTLFFEYRTIRELADYFIANHSGQLASLLAPTGAATTRQSSDPGARQPRAAALVRRGAARPPYPSGGSLATARPDPIAIIGLSGRYPEAIDVEAYWNNLRDGTDCITEVPKERWDWQKYFSEDRSQGGRHYSKWGGFIAGVDEFDPLFFNISPVDAELMDPQERLFLQHAWMAIEDAGYTRATLQEPSGQDLSGQVGVYVGVMYSEYQLFGAEAHALGRRLALPGSTASIANRVSYALNLHGTSVTLDTMCSSSLTAIHFACQDLKLGQTSLAIAGGVNVSIHPNKYLVLSGGQFISSEGHCQSFGVGGDGYIPGEGVGVVVLKRLSEAERDGDHIYGIIRGSALNHGGKTHGYTVPNPQAQAGVISRALAQSQTNARHVSYLEAHGTGTKLGDPIEIAALSKAFQQSTEDTQFCLIGSAKSNIGHCESAAGVAGLTKVLLQMQHQQIVPSLHSAELNPHIDFAKSPFVVNQSLRPWEQPVIDGRKLPRIAGISSFGAGGSNAHVIVEEYQQPVQQPAPFANVVILLSARTTSQLRQKARDLADFVRPRLSTIDLVAVAYTLQVGREAMDERLAFVVGSAEELSGQLDAYSAGAERIEDAYRGQAKSNPRVLSWFSTDTDLQQTIDKWIADRRFSKLLDLWVSGVEVDWRKLYGDAKPRRISLPTYPFARERHWIDTAGGPVAARDAALPLLHPLLHSNTSDLNEQRYSSTFTGEEFFLAGHQVKTQKMLPGVAYLEMARAAVELALPERPESTLLELHNTVWIQPIVVSERKQVSIALWADDDEQIDYEIYSRTSDQETVHCQGRAILSRQPAPAPLDLEQLEGQMGRGKLEPDRVYAACARMGLVYGPALRGVIAVHQGTGQLLAELRLPGHSADSLEGYVLHPTLMDGALQACVGLIAGSPERADRPRVPFALESLRIVAPCVSWMFAWIRYSPGSQAEDDVVKVDIDLCDERGDVCIQMRGLSSRVLTNEIGRSATPEQAIGSLLAAPVWQASSVEAVAAAPELAEHHVILCELPNIDVGTFESVLPRSQCSSLQAAQQATIAQRYSDYAVACFERIQAILQGKPQSRVLVQIVIADHQEQEPFAGLSGLLKTAALENPQFVGQLILVPVDMTAEELARHLNEETTLGLDPLVKRERGARQVLHWQEVPADPESSPIAFKDQGVYLITGGLGGLGVLFAKEILQQTRKARVILTGRSVLSAEIEVLLNELSAEAGRASYRQVDLGDLEQVEKLIAGIHDEHRQLDGILHCAGMIADHFILKKHSSEFRAVLAPKVIGTYNLDRATRDVALDFFVLFSSIAGALGNLGQADYAAANGFMDRFAAYRNRQVSARQRQGRTRSINWPLWQAGGMGIDPANLELLQRTTGMQPMQTATGMQAFHRSLALPYDQILVVEGDLAQVRRALPAGRPVPPTPSRPVAADAAEIDSASLAKSTEEWLRRELAGVMKLPAHEIDPQAALEKYGIDSILAMRLTNELEKTFGTLSKTLFFEYQTLAGLAGYFVKTHSAIVRQSVGLPDEGPKPKRALAAGTVEKTSSGPARRSQRRAAGSRTSDRKDIAIIGLAGRYPLAENLQEFWRNLQNGRDCITEIPADRWDHALYYDPDPNKVGKSYSKWGGFIADVDKFDPLFFNISPKEATVIDPQERLFLETAWQAIEDAGYTKAGISGRRVGVYVGVMWGQYELFGAESLLRGNASISSSSHASVANRVSYFFDFHGPSLAMDTMCSSSLTAIHLACEELRRGEIDAAIAGGVNLTVHPYKYVSLSLGKFAASDGRCRSFGEGGDGYVPGEGVGAVLLKPLEHALRDGDQIYALIKSSTVNHGGKTNGYSVPNPNAQADLIRDALDKAKIHPGTLSYVETHGTGTSLGDPIEITALSKAFEGCAEKQFCPIGSVKSNIGHLESAAGIAAVTKALLQIRHNQLVPSLHAHPPNPNINFKESPFYVQTELKEWSRPAAHPRRVGVSSFGAGGSNAHLILEEYASAREPESAASPEVVVLSARDPDALCRYAERFVAFLENASDLSLANVAFTSQVGRTPMSARLAIITHSVEDLRVKLKEWVALKKWPAGGRPAAGAPMEEHGEHLANVFYGNAREAQYGAGNLIEGQAGKAYLEDLLANRDLERIARFWVLGGEIDWSLLDRSARPRRVSLPTYPFARERCWVVQETPGQETPSPRGQERTRDDRKAAARTYYYPQWSSKAVGAQNEKQATGPVLMLDTSEELFLAMRDQFENGSLVLLISGTSFQEIEPNVFVIDPEREEQFHQLVANLRDQRLPRVVLHHCGEVGDLEVEEQVTRQLRGGAHALLHLCEALMKEPRQKPLRIMSVFSGHGDETAPLCAAMDGFFKTLTLESPRIRAKVVEIRNEPISEEAGLIWDEVLESDWTAQEIRYEKRNARFVRGLVPKARPERQPSALPLRRNGVYLITGGLGGLGSIFGEYLAKTYQARLVLVGRSAPNAKQEEKLRQWKSYGAEVLCLQGDVSRLDDMEAVVREARTQFSRLDGVIHAAGVNRDAFILKKTREEMEAVLAPKVYGAINTDLATRSEPLDWFVLFSSVAGVLGNFGQSDYAYGNRFLDSFAESREHMRKAQKRSGRTLSIAWPLWEEGGMGVSREQVALLEEQTGMRPMPTEDGIRYFEDFLRSDEVQGVALYGIPSRIADYVARQSERTHRSTSGPTEDLDAAVLVSRTEAYLRGVIGEEIRLDPDRIDSADPLESFGIDSVMINRINANLEKDLGALPKTLLYEHETIRDVAAFLLREAREALIALFGLADSAGEPAFPAMEIAEDVTRGGVSTAEKIDDLEAIAIIGIHGRYPHATNPDEYWHNLKHGRDSIDLVPANRWDHEQLYHPDPAAAAEGKIYCKWGGFLDGHDRFDARFFHISTAEAKVIDPQERLFLESVWAAIEDAGYTRDSLKARFPKTGSANVGVFVGVTTNSYNLWTAEERTRGNFACPTAMPWSIANRVSYFFDFNGPSLPVDTACSSSLVALHLACESLRNGDCEVAIAGGVNLYLHPAKYLSLCQRRMLSLDGKCHSYGAGDDGFVPGEGVGTVVLKPLRKAIADRDSIYAVIRSSAFDHSGRSNGYSAPNPNAQASLIGRTLERARIHPETIGYVEGHGTGTQLGDSIEIAALTKAFRKQTARKQFCPIGCVKANIGHSESAAGIAGLAKVILQMQHGQLAPSIHSDVLSPNIEFEESPFYLQHELSEWPSTSGHPRRALINSFGAGGVNACVVLEEYEKRSPSYESKESGPYLFAMSAKNEDRLREYADRLLAQLRSEPGIDLAGLCYTLQVGREAMEERLAIVVSDVGELIERLEDWSKRGSAANIHRGSLGPRRGTKRSLKVAKTGMGEQSLIDLASKWIAGEDVDWDSLYSGRTPRRISAPTYPFARERYWFSDSPVSERPAPSSARLHPLIAYNSSTLNEVSFSSSLSESEFYAVDHKVHEERIFPGAGFLEMACISGNIASDKRVRKIKDVVWIQPLSFHSGAQPLRTVLRHAGDGAEYVISSFSEEDETVVHSEGRLTFGNGRADPADAEDRMSLPALKAQCTRSEAGADFYDKFGEYGLHYGPAFQTIREIHVNGSFALAKLELAEHLQSEFGQFILHPSMIDGALQTAAGLIGSLVPGTPYVPFALDEVEIIRPVPRACYAYAERADAQTQKNAGVTKFNIRLLSESGDVLIKFKNLYVRPLSEPGNVARALQERH